MAWAIQIPCACGLRCIGCNMILAQSVVVLISTSIAVAQGSGEWIWTVVTSDGDAIVEPGEVAEITLSLDLTPNVGELQDDGESVFAFGGALPLNIWGGANADKGTIVDWVANPFLAFPGGRNDGTNITDVLLMQIPQQPVDNSDPIDLVSFQWIPFKYQPMVVSYNAESFFEDKLGFLVWETFGMNGDHHPVRWDLVATGGTFLVIPSPSDWALLFVAVIPRRRVRKRRQSVR